MPVYTELQPVFDKIWQEFVVDKREQAMIPGWGCVFRSDRNKDSKIRCAIGVCIPDDMYDSKLESYGAIGDIARHMPEWFESVFNGIEVDRLAALQYIHDMRFDQFENEMREFANEHDLAIPKS